MIWKGRPFETQDKSSSKCGEIAKIYSNGDFLVKTGDSFFLVDDFSVSPEGHEPGLKEGCVLSSCNFKKQITDIIERHYKKYPQLILSDDILNLVEHKK